MGHYLITGYAGSGKSSVAVEMQKRGLTAFDGDKVPGLSRWEDVHTGEPVVVDPKQYVDFSKVSWNWNEQTLKELLASNNPLFLCGSSSNQTDFHILFDKVFMLKLSKETQAKRLASRQDNPFGKHPKQLKEILAEYKTFLSEAVAKGATPIDAEQAIKAIVDDIVSQVSHGN